MNLEEARRRYTSGKVRLVDGKGGLPCLEIRTPLAEATVYLYGGHVTHFQPSGEKPVLFMSSQSAFEQGKPIRGGVPVCYPWFGAKTDDASAPMHGLVRLQMWEIESVSEQAGGEIEVILAIKSGDASRKYWAGEFHLQYRIRIGRELSMSLVTHNSGKAPFTIQEAFHTYFVVGDARQASVSGLEPAPYFDKVQNMKACPAAGTPITIAGETDRLYADTESTTMIVDPALSRRIVIAKSGSRSTVVWNPWIAKSAALPDFGNDEWLGMLCVETANAGPNAVTIASGATHTMQACISIQRL